METDLQKDVRGFLSIQAQDFIEDHCLDSVPIGAGGYS